MPRRTFRAAAALVLATPALAADPVKIGHIIARTGLFAAAALRGDPAAARLEAGRADGRAGLPGAGGEALLSRLFGAATGRRCSSSAGWPPGRRSAARRAHARGRHRRQGGDPPADPRLRRRRRGRPDPFGRVPRTAGPPRPGYRPARGRGGGPGPRFLSTANLTNLPLRAPVLGGIAIGMTCDILSGDFDLSVGAVAALSGCVGAAVMVALVPGAAMMEGPNAGATLAGVDMRRAKAGAFALCRALAGLAGVMLAARPQSGQPMAGHFQEICAIGAGEPGGGSLHGGEGRLWRSMVGLRIVVLLSSRLNILNLVPHWQELAIGLVILAATAIDRLRPDPRAGGGERGRGHPRGPSRREGHQWRHSRDRAGAARAVATAGLSRQGQGSPA